MGKVRVQVQTVNGKTSYTILGHSEGATCHNVDGEKLLNRLINQPIAGFGNAGTVEDGGKTQEFFESKPTQTRAIPAQEEPEDQWGNSGTTVKQKQKGGDLTGGFGT